MGVKLFAWIGGFVLFLGVVFLVKYSFENNLVTPRMRIVIGTLIGLGLIAAGWRATRKNYRVPGQSLCATGILVLYASIFAAHAFYNLISLTPAFALMSCVTVARVFSRSNTRRASGGDPWVCSADFLRRFCSRPARIIRLRFLDTSHC